MVKGSKGRRVKAAKQGQKDGRGNWEDEVGVAAAAAAV